MKQTRLGRARSQKLFWAGVLLFWLVVAALVFQIPQSALLQWRVPGTQQVLHIDNSGVMLLLAAVPSLLIGVGLSLSGLSLAQRLLSFVLRAGFLVCLVLSLARPLEETPSHRTCHVALLDVSQSVSDLDLEQARTQLSRWATQLKPGDQLQLITFAEEPRSRALHIGPPPDKQGQPDTHGLLQMPALAELREGHRGEGTNLELALDHALSYVSSDCHNRYLVMSDGIETRGHALSTVTSLVERHIAVVVRPFEQAEARDVAVTALTPEGQVRLGEPFMVRVELTASQAGHGQLRLYQGETLNGLDSVRAIDVPPGVSAHTFKSVARVGGKVTYRAEYLPQEQDAFLANNSYVLSMDVPGPPRVLVIDRKPSQVTQLVDALVAQQFDVDVRGPDAFPRSAQELDRFDFLVLSDLAREQVSRGAEALVERYVRSGGGLLFAGGEAGYGPGGWQGSNLEKILPVRMDAKKEREIPGVAMALVIDRSGSMTGVPLSMAKEACIATVGVLAPSDLIEVIAFDSRPTSFVPLQPARYRLRIEEAVARIQPGGGTEIFNSLDRAYQSLSSVEARRKHIVLLTDGNASSDGIHELVSTAFAEGITITAVGLGGGTNQALLAMIAETGGGRFVVAQDPARLPRIFTREAELISTKPTLDDWFPITVVKNVEFLAGIHAAALPLLRGYTSTQLAPAPAELIFQSDRGEPILARQRVGLGWALAWTSDLKARWATDLLRSRQFGQMLAQLVRAHQKSDQTHIRPMEVQLRGDELVARVDAFNEHDQFLNDLHSTLHVERQATGNVAPEPAQSAEFSTLAPGLYEAKVKLPGPGAYAVRAEHRRAGKAGKLVPAGVSFGSVSWPYPEEYRDLKPRVEFLRRLAHLTNGATVQGAALPETRDAHQVLRRTGRQSVFICIAIALFFLDLFTRRVRLGGFGPASAS